MYRCLPTTSWSIQSLIRRACLFHLPCVSPSPAHICVCMHVSACFPSIDWLSHMPNQSWQTEATQQSNWLVFMDATNRADLVPCYKYGTHVFLKTDHFFNCLPLFLFPSQNCTAVTVKTWYNSFSRYFQHTVLETLCVPQLSTETMVRGTNGRFWPFGAIRVCIHYWQRSSFTFIHLH